MDALGIAQADVAGHSHGGAVALMLAARHPQRVRSLVLFAPANPFCDYPRPMIRLYSSKVGRLIARCAPYLPRPIHMFALGRMYGDPARIQSGTIEGYISGLRVPGTVQHILAIVRSWFDEMAGLAAVLPSLSAIPTLLAWGDQDRAMSLASGRELHRRMSASELVVFHGAGHVVFEELPEAANRLMLEWLQRDLSYKKTAARAARVPPALANDARMSGTGRLGAGVFP
jgi:pimeloyl-ACP methyl ester carboxylesterase